MARDYHTVPGMFYHFYFDNCADQYLSASTVAVECIFSKCYLIITHICNCLSAQSTWALMCLRAWSSAEYVFPTDLTYTASLPEPKEDDIWSDDNWEVIS